MIAIPIRAADAARFVALARAFHAEDGHPVDPAGEAAILEVAAGVPLAPAFFLQEEGETVGYFALSLSYSLENGGTDGFIDDLYLLPQARGRGLGRQALALALEEARKHGIRVLLLEVEAGNHRAYNLYQSAGFIDRKRRLLSLDLR